MGRSGNCNSSDDSLTPLLKAPFPTCQGFQSEHRPDGTPAPPKQTHLIIKRQPVLNCQEPLLSRKEFLGPSPPSTQSFPMVDIIQRTTPPEPIQKLDAFSSHETLLFKNLPRHFPRCIRSILGVQSHFRFKPKTTSHSTPVDFAVANLENREHPSFWIAFSISNTDPGHYTLPTRKSGTQNPKRLGSCP
jgi:hypothetical protein